MAKIYVQQVLGKYRHLKNRFAMLLLLFYFFIPWLRWDRGLNNPSQAVLIDLPKRQGYFFDIQIWSEEIFYITAILIIAAFSLFLCTAIFGRLWCGFACPHTVFVDLFIKIEAFFQGDMNARIKLDTQEMSRLKICKIVSTHLSWLIVSFAFAFGWVCYFYDAPQLVRNICNITLGSNPTGWLIAITASTYFFAGFMREKVCTYFCPYGRFQSVMLDDDSLVVTYHGWRGEPRWQKAKQQNIKGDCVNCNRCVFVCPMGIDIRDGLQLQCIGCGLCVDACNEVMHKLHQPLNLIAYDSINSTKILQEGNAKKINILRPKVLLYAFMITMASFLLVRALANKSSFLMFVERERGALFTITPDGKVRNSYRLYVANKSLNEQTICLKIAGIDDVDVQMQQLNSYLDNNANWCFAISAQSENNFNMFLKVDKTQFHYNESPIHFIAWNQNQKIVQVDSIFVSK